MASDGVSAISFGDPKGQIDPPVGCAGVLALSAVFVSTTETTTVDGRRFARVPEADRARAAIAKLRVLRDALWSRAKLPRTLSETGKIRRDQLPEIARASLDDGALIMNPVDVRYEDALRVLERAY